MTPSSETLSGWGNTAPSRAVVERPRSAEEVAGALAESAGPIIARGLGRSYGDASQCAGGTVLLNRGLWTLSAIDPSTGSVTVGAGVSLDELLKVSIPAGFFIPVTPGTRQVTIGGAIAADIHGKNHHVDGSFMRHVSSMTLATPLGVEVVTETSDPALFWATAGGMGLTGVIIDATIALLPIESSYVSVDTERFNDLDGVMDAMISGDDRYRYSVAWVDCMTAGPRLGRGVLTRADHASLDELSPRQGRRPLMAPGAAKLTVPVTAPPGLVNKLTITAFNEAWFRKAPKKRDGEIQSLSTFFHPLDGISHWNRMHGPRGFLQYQFCVPDSESQLVRSAIERLAGAGIPSLIAVLKRFGPGDPGPLSFPIEGWTLALDVPLSPPGLPSVLDELDELVAGAGGRLYLAKDSRLAPALLRSMYPKTEALAEVRRRVDPKGLLASDLSRRLGID